MVCPSLSPLKKVAGFLVVFTLLASSQEKSDERFSARNILDKTEAEQTTFITSTMEQGFPEDRADQMTMLIINRSAVTIPLIEAKLEEMLKSASPSKGFIDIASEMIAYAGDEQALRAVGKLLAIDGKRFERLIGRTLDNAGNWR